MATLRMTERTHPEACRSQQTRGGVLQDLQDFGRLRCRAVVKVLARIIKTNGIVADIMTVHVCHRTESCHFEIS